MTDSVPIELITTREAHRTVGDDRRLTRSAQYGEVIRLRAGVFAQSESWESASDDERYSARITAAISTRRGPVVLSHESAARMWGIPIIGRWPREVHITEPDRSSRRSKRGVRVHRRPLAEHEAIRLGDFWVTSRERTVIDLARDGEFRDAVAATDFLLDRRHPLCDRDSLRLVVEAGGTRGAARAAHVLDFATDLSESVLESFGRVQMLGLGFPRPTLQHEVRLADGRLRRLDYWWERYGVGAEADGRIKYESSPAEAVWAEKRREAQLADVGVRFARFGWPDCSTPSLLATRLRAVGLPRSGTPFPPALQ